MQLRCSFEVDDVKRSFLQMKEILPLGRIGRLFDSIDSATRSNEMLRDFYQRRFSFEFDMLIAHRSMEDVDGPIKIRGTSGFIHCRYAILFSEIFNSLTIEQKKRFKRRLEGACADSLGLRPVLHEIDVLFLLIANGWSVELNDIDSKTGGFDYLALRADKAIEVECKYYMFEATRLLSEEQFYRVRNDIHQKAINLLRGRSGLYLIRVSIERRMTKDRIDELVRRIDKIDLDNSQFIVSSGVSCSVEQRNFDEMRALLDNGAANQTRISAYLQKIYGIDDCNHIAVFHLEREHAAIFAFIEDPRKLLAESIHDTLKGKSAKQFTGQRPAAFCIGFENPHFLVQNTRAPGHTPFTAFISDRLFDNPNRIFVHSVNMIDFPNVYVYQDKIFFERAIPAVINVDHTCYDDKSLLLFSNLSGPEMTINLS